MAIAASAVRPATRSVVRLDGRYTVLRPPLFMRLVMVLPLAFLGWMALAAGSGGDGVPLPLSATSCCLLAAAAVRQWRLGVELGPTVRINNFFRTRVLPWDQVVAFRFGDGAWVDLDGRRRLSITAFSPGMRALPYVQRQCQDAVRQMENRRKSRLQNRRGRFGKQTTS